MLMVMRLRWGKVRRRGWTECKLLKHSIYFSPSFFIIVCHAANTSRIYFRPESTKTNIHVLSSTDKQHRMTELPQVHGPCSKVQYGLIVRLIEYLIKSARARNSALYYYIKCSHSASAIKKTQKRDPDWHCFCHGLPRFRRPTNKQPLTGGDESLASTTSEAVHRLLRPWQQTVWPPLTMVMVLFFLYLTALLPVIMISKGALNPTLDFIAGTVAVRFIFLTKKNPIPFDPSHRVSPVLWSDSLLIQVLFLHIC